MNNHHTLDSAKYFTNALAVDRRSHRKSQLAMVWNIIVNCMLAISVGVLMYIAITLMPYWFPVVETWFHEFTKYKYA